MTTLSLPDAAHMATMMKTHNGAEAPRPPGIYRGKSSAEFGLWRKRPDGVWLFCLPVHGSVWEVAADQSGEGLTQLVDADNVCRLNEPDEVTAGTGASTTTQIGGVAHPPACG